MRYLGGIQGAGILKCGDDVIAGVEYDFEAFVTQPGRVAGSGEIRMSPEALRNVFGRAHLHLQTDTGRRFSLRFSEKRLRSASDVAHVEITGDDLPHASEWSHRAA